MWVRGLKLFKVNNHFNHRIVAPRVGAWIETIDEIPFLTKKEKSHPVWVRGLKLSECGYYLLDVVAPRVGAWIETEIPKRRPYE